MTPASPQEDPIQAEILQAALQLYRKFGPDKVGMDDVAKAAGRSRTSLYYYYKNQNEIFGAAMDAIVVEAAKELRKAITDTGTFEDHIHTFCLTRLRISREWKLILREIWPHLYADGPSKQLKAAAELHQKVVHEEGLILKDILATAIEKKDIRPLSAEEQDRWIFVLTSGIRGIRNEIADQNLTPSVKASVRVLSGMATNWLRYEGHKTGQD